MKNAWGIINPKVLLMLTILGFAIFLFITSSVSFRSQFLNTMYPKPESHAAGTVVWSQCEPRMTDNPEIAPAAIGDIAGIGKAHPMWCYDALNPMIQDTFETGDRNNPNDPRRNSWVDEFNHGKLLSECCGTGYIVYDDYSTPKPPNNDSNAWSSGLYKVKTWAHNNHWMTDIAGSDLDGSEPPWRMGGTYLQIKRPFKFEDYGDGDGKKLIIDADFAAGIPAYGGDIWGEIVFSTSPDGPTDYYKQNPEDRVDGGPDSLYALGHFSQYYSYGCRINSGPGFICQAWDNGRFRSEKKYFETQNLSAFTQSATVFAREYYPYNNKTDWGETIFRKCTTNDPDLNCRDRIRMEVTKTTLKLYVNGWLWYSVTNNVPIPDEWINSDNYVYYSTFVGKVPWEYKAVRTHWDRLAVNPRDAQGRPIPAGAPPTWFGHLPDGTPNGSGPTPTPNPTGTPTASSTPIASATPVATATPQPTPTGDTIGNTQIGNNVDTSTAHNINSSPFTMGSTTKTVQSMSVYVAGVDNAPNNQYQLAIYTNSNGAPGTLVAQTQSGNLTPNAWNTLPITATLQAGQTYWFAYNNNGTNGNVNNPRFSTSSVQNAWRPQSFGNWPTPFGTPNFGTGTLSIYASFTGSGSSELVYASSLNGANEVLVSGSQGTATGVVRVNGNNALVTMKNLTGLSSTQTMAHIHGPAPVGQNAGILFTLPVGNFTNQQFTFNQQQLSELANSQYYFNVHTQNFGNGEIRGQIQRYLCDVNDTTGQGLCNIFDYNRVISNFGKTEANNPGDLDGNGLVNVQDLNLVVRHFNLDIR